MAPRPVRTTMLRIARASTGALHRGDVLHCCPGVRLCADVPGALHVLSVRTLLSPGGDTRARIFADRQMRIVVATEHITGTRVPCQACRLSVACLQRVVVAGSSEESTRQEIWLALARDPCCNTCCGSWRWQSDLVRHIHAAMSWSATARSRLRRSCVVLRSWESYKIMSARR